MRKLTAVLCAAMLVACGSDETGEGEAAEAAGVTIADFAGSWSISAMIEGTEEPVTTTLAGSADGSDWSMTLQDRDPIPVQVSISGDSLIGVTEQYESVLREGVMVTVRMAMVLVGEEAQGTLVATYQTDEGQEVVQGTASGTRSMN